MQEFAPQEQNKREELHIPYYRKRSERQKSGDALKEEHPSTFEDVIPPYSYPAQDRVTQARNRNEEREEREGREGGQREQARRRFSPDGDAFETGYRPYTQYNRQPPLPWWARPQPQHASGKILRWLMLIVGSILFVKLAIFLIPLILGLFAVLALIILIPIVILFGLIIAFLFMLGLGIPLGRGRWVLRPGRNRWRW